MDTPEEKSGANPGSAVGPAAAEPVPGGPEVGVDGHRYWKKTGKVNKYDNGFVTVTREEILDTGIPPSESSIIYKVTVRCSLCEKELLVYYDFVAAKKVVSVGSREHFTVGRGGCIY
ncbi:MAG: hypothetical protein QXP84_07690 [Candidatus Korarchaeum sp.]